MCSVSWLIDSSGYQIFFNRDEQKTRGLALPPQYLDIDGTEVLMPIDPVGKGSWISTNEHGLSLCLLNNYQGQVPSGKLISRGQLLRDLSNASGIKEVERRFKELNLACFAPFTLLAFAPNLGRGSELVWAFEWDGKAFSIGVTQAPKFSSGVELEIVTEYRQQVYQKCEKNTEAHLAFHRQHHPSQSHLSVCMHRQDAQTVSFTNIKVTQNQQEMIYVAGAPCENLSSKNLHQNRYKLKKSAVAC
ncbi:NRDE family protein [Marinomonas epiphytica]